MAVQDLWAHLPQDKMSNELNAGPCGGMYCSGRRRNRSRRLFADPRFPDFNLLDFFLCGHLKSFVHLLPVAVATVKEDHNMDHRRFN
ncbi:hypothetical protein TNCV_1762291 [Trichonephila clavipes]|nr:hypothetical protein TNCV_1762291 [Trichonephila clavipes]